MDDLLEGLRRVVADDTLEHYDFGADVEVVGTGGWSYLAGSGPSTYTQAIFLQDRDQADKPSRRVYLHVRFADGEVEPASVEVNDQAQ